MGGLIGRLYFSGTGLSIFLFFWCTGPSRLTVLLVTELTRWPALLCTGLSWLDELGAVGKVHNLISQHWSTLKKYFLQYSQFCNPKLQLNLTLRIHLCYIEICKQK